MAQKIHFPNDSHHLLPDYEELVALRKQLKPRNFSSKAKVHSSMFGDHSSLFRGRGLDFSEFRDYAPGDDIRSIDWRVTARTGRAHTKIFTEERERNVFIIVDINGYMEFGTRNTFKSIQAARAAALLAWQAHELHDRVGAVLFGHLPERIQILPAKRSRKSIWDMLKILCKSRPSPAEIKIDEALSAANKSIPTGSAVFIISDFFHVSLEFEKQLGLLSRRCEIQLIKISDPADKSIPAVDEIQFSNELGNKIVVNTNDVSCGETYRQLWAKNDLALKVIGHKFRTKILHLTTERDVSADLYFGTRSLSKGNRGEI